MKQKLLLIAAALLCSVGVWAQTDVTSKYLTNPSFESGDMTGWSSYGYNPEGDEGVVDASSFGVSRLVADYPLSNSEGEYICDFYGNRWTGWWSFYTISQTVLLPAGEYQLSAILGSSNGYTISLFAFPEGSGELNATGTYTNISSEILSSDDQNNVGYLKTVTFTSDGATSMVLGAGLINHSSRWGTFFKADNFKLYRLTDVTSQYITNAGFDACTAESSDVAAKTIKDYSSNGWTKTSSGDFTTIAVTAYGGGKKLATSTTPSTKKDGTTVSGNTLGIIAGWADEVKIQSSDITLPAGVYTLTVDHYLTSSTTNYTTSYFGFVTGSASHLVSSTSFTASTWTTETVSFTLTENTTGKVQIGLKGNNKEGSSAPAVFYDDVKLTYSPFADDGDYTELSTAISTVEAYTLGFDAGEYASYNVLPILNAAKAIDQEANNSLATVRGLIDALNAITPNAAEVNAIYDGDFDDAKDNVAVNTIPKGWRGSDSHPSDGYWTRYMYSDGSSNAGLLHFSNGSAMMSKTTPRYGLDTDYTMPLKADTYYTLKFDYAGWDSQLVTTVIITDGSDAAVTITPSATETSANAGQTNTSDWKSYTGTFKTNNAGNYKLKFNKTEHNGSGGQVAYGAISLVRATAAEIKPFLLAEIAAANDTYNGGANVGTGVFQIPTAAGDAFNTAINTTAQGVYDNNSATVGDVVTAIDNLKAAEETYANTTLNAPADGKKYYIKVATSGHAKENNAWLTFLSTTDANNPTGYKIQANNAPADYLAQAYTFTQVSGNTYNISIALPEGEVYLTYGSLNGSAADWKKSQIQATTAAEDKGGFKIVATNTANVFNIVNTETSSTIACQSGGNIYTESGNADFTLAEASQASVSVNLTAGKYGTRIFPFAPTLPSAITAYSCAEVDGTTLNLVEVGSPEANKPYIIYSEDGYSGAALTGYGTATATSYTTGLLTGVYTSTAVPVNSYVLQTLNGKQAFYQVSSEDPVSAPAYRAYLTTDAGDVKAFFFNLDDADAISGLTPDPSLSKRGEEIFNLAGQRMSKLQRGVNIVNGKKILVK